MKRIIPWLMGAAVVLTVAGTAGAQSASPEAGSPWFRQLPRTYDEILALQRQMRQAGCNPGKLDGLMGRRTLEALACLAAKVNPGEMARGRAAPGKDGPLSGTDGPTPVPGALVLGTPTATAPIPLGTPAATPPVGGLPLPATTDCAGFPPQPVPCRPEWPTLVLYTQNFPPYVETGAGNSVTGPITQVIWSVCERIQHNCRVAIPPFWQTARQEVRDGKADGLFVILWTLQTEEFLLQSTPIAAGEYGLFVRADDPLETKPNLEIEALNDYRVLVYHPSGTSGSAELFRQRLADRGVTIFLETAYTSTELALAALAGSTGQAAVYSNRDVGLDVASQLGLDNLRYAGRDKPLVYHVGFSNMRVDPTVVARFDKAFIDLCAEGVLQRFYKDIRRPDACRRRINEVADEGAGMAPAARLPGSERAKTN